MKIPIFIDFFHDIIFNLSFPFKLLILLNANEVSSGLMKTFSENEKKVVCKCACTLENCSPCTEAHHMQQSPIDVC